MIHITYLVTCLRHVTTTNHDFNVIISFHPFLRPYPFHLYSIYRIQRVVANDVFYLSGGSGNVLEICVRSV